MGGRWTPDGRQIVYGHYSGGGKIAIMNADGTGERLLTDGVDDDADPAV
jgi:Tol biopolymer transport system component